MKKDGKSLKQSDDTHLYIITIATNKYLLLLLYVGWLLC